MTTFDSHERWCWLREILGTDITIDKFGDLVVKELNGYYPNAECIHYGDPAVAQVNDKSERTSKQILKDKGIIIRHRQSTYRERKEIIEQKLAHLIGDKPALLVDKRYCKTANDGFLGGYHYPLKKEKQQFIDAFEMPVKDGFYEHIMNAGEYIAVNLFKPFKTQDTRNLPRQQDSEYGILTH